MNKKKQLSFHLIILCAMLICLFNLSFCLSGSFESYNANLISYNKDKFIDLNTQNLQLILVANTGNHYLTPDSIKKTLCYDYAVELLYKPELSNVWFIPEIVNLFKNSGYTNSHVILLGNYLSMQSPLTFLYPDEVEDIWLSALKPTVLAIGVNEFYKFRFKKNLSDGKYSRLWTNVVEMLNGYNMLKSLSEINLGGIKIAFVNLISFKYLSVYSLSQWGIKYVEEPIITLKRLKDKFSNYDLIFLICYLTKDDLSKVLPHLSQNTRIIYVDNSENSGFDNELYFENKNKLNINLNHNKIIFFKENEFLKIIQIQKYAKDKFYERIINFDLDKVANKWFKKSKKNYNFYEIENKNMVNKKLKSLVSEFEKVVNKPVFYISNRLLRINEFYKISPNLLARTVLKNSKSDAVIIQVEEENFSDIRNINLAFLFNRYGNQHFFEICGRKAALVDLIRQINIVVNYKRLGFANLKYGHISNLPVYIVINNKEINEKSLYRIGISEKLYLNDLSKYKEKFVVNPVDVTLWDCIIRSFHEEAIMSNFFEKEK